MKLSELILKNAPNKIEVLEPVNPFANLVMPTVAVNPIYVLQQQLEETDYIFIKTFEAEMVGKPQPYTDKQLKDISNYRDGLREIINGLTGV